MIDPLCAPLPRFCSTSQITTYGICPRQYTYKYVLRVPSLTTSEAMEIGSRVHSAIADASEEADLRSDVEREMVARARAYQAAFPPDPIYETTFEDRENPGRIYGDIDGHTFVGIFDVHWLTPRIALDWKTGNYKPRYTTSLETQAYILGELYAEKYDQTLDDMLFMFLRTNDIHYAKAVTEGRSRTAAIKRIRTTLERIEAREFKKCISPLCQYCEHAEICKIDVGFR